MYSCPLKPLTAVWGDVFPIKLAWLQLTRWFACMVEELVFEPVLSWLGTFYDMGMWCSVALSFKTMLFRAAGRL